MEEQGQNDYIRNSFTFYKSFEDAIEDMDKDNQLAVYRAISRYSLYGEELKLSGLALLAWKLIKPTLDRSRTRSMCGSKARGIPKPTMTGNANHSKQNQSKIKANSKQNQSNPLKEIEIEGNNKDIISIKESTNVPKKGKACSLPINERLSCFEEELKTYIPKYGEAMIKDFYNYWAEPDRDKRKMRFELQRTWNTAMRLATWYGNTNNYQRWKP